MKLLKDDFCIAKICFLEWLKNYIAPKHKIFQYFSFCKIDLPEKETCFPLRKSLSFHSYFTVYYFEFKMPHLLVSAYSSHDAKKLRSYVRIVEAI